MKKIGLYKIVNKINGKKYYGSSVDIDIRRYNHFRDLENDKHHAFKLQRAYNKYGKESFRFKIITLCDESILRELEQRLLDTTPEYNTSYEVGKNTGMRHSNKTKRKMSKSRTGKIQSKSTIEKRCKQSRKAVLQYSLNGKLLNAFISLKDANDKTGVDFSSISKACRGKLNTAGKYKWKFKTHANVNK